ncbi:hypothetical protein SCWH03_45050 [Streptomyces pacificus]|uniref:Transposase IS204/IS1001/IS1096/IS1165 zinc-finger domain-containing protein n=1 Tax=Streptomyces pacificus TaxID=2705029 RepID=A0A6A0B0N1_9ACTN|nr:hypothetical protein SCWH03_45050 [Streptomyces pacificus]
MSLFRIWKRTLTAENTVVEGVRIDENEQCVVVSVRPDARRRQRCGRCRRPAPWCDAGRGRRRWRDLDHGVILVFLEADAPRVACREHGVTAAAVPWACHGAGHTHAFDRQTAWMLGLRFLPRGLAHRDVLRVRARRAAPAAAGPLGPHPVAQRLPADSQILADALEGVARGNCVAQPARLASATPWPCVPTTAWTPLSDARPPPL